jgi:hypothetical protein
MLIQLAISLPNKAAPLRKTVTLSGKSNAFTFALDAAPTAVVLDPDGWVLMEGEMVEK